MAFDQSNYLTETQVSTIYISSFSTGENIDFKAFLTDFSDNYTSNWNTQEIYGKMDPIYTYKNTVRKITIAFDVPSFNIEEATSNSKKADSIIRSLYPMYHIEEKQKGTAIISGPPFFKIKFANLIVKADGNVNSNDAMKDGLLGWIDGFNFKPELESGFFIGKAENNSQILIPKLYKVNFNFNVLHEHPLGIESGANKIPRLQTKKFAHFFESISVSAPEQPKSEETPKDSTQEAANGEDNVPEGAGQ